MKIELIALDNSRVRLVSAALGSVRGVACHCKAVSRVAEKPGKSGFTKSNPVRVQRRSSPWTDLPGDECSSAWRTQARCASLCSPACTLLAGYGHRGGGCQMLPLALADRSPRPRVIPRVIGKMSEYAPRRAMASSSADSQPKHRNERVFRMEFSPGGALLRPLARHLAICKRQLTQARFTIRCEGLVPS
jgi:hypothetical protein